VDVKSAPVATRHAAKTFITIQHQINAVVTKSPCQQLAHTTLYYTEHTKAQ